MNTKIVTEPKPTEQFNFTGIAITLIVLAALSFLIDVETIKEGIVSAGAWAPLIFIFLKILTIVVAPLSGSPLYVLVGVFFGFWPGLLYVAIGDLIGYSTAFGISRVFGKPLVEKFVSKKESGLLARIVSHVGTLKGFIHVCIVCFAVPELLSYGAGLSRLAYWKFILTIMPLSMAMAAVLALFGSSLGSSEQSLIASAGVPIVFTVIVLIGGSLFFKSIKKKNDILAE